MTVTRLLGFVWYRLNAYRVFPPLRVRPSLFRRSRLREVTGFSVYMLVQNVSNRLNYATDPMVIAAFLGTGAVAVWTVAQRLAEMTLRLTNQLNEVLFPVVVECDSAQRHDRLRELLLHGTRLSLALALPVGGVLMILADPVVVGWTGPHFRRRPYCVQLLALTVLVRVGTATAGTVLRGAGHHRLLANSNLVRSPGQHRAEYRPRPHARAARRGRRDSDPGRDPRLRDPGSGGLRAGGRAARAFCDGSGLAGAVARRVIALGGLALVRHRIAASLLACFGFGIGVGVLYLLLFIGVAIGRVDRVRYLGKLRGLTPRPALKVA